MATLITKITFHKNNRISQKPILVVDDINHNTDYQEYLKNYEDIDIDDCNILFIPGIYNTNNVCVQIAVSKITNTYDVICIKNSKEILI